MPENAKSIRLFSKIPQFSARPARFRGHLLANLGALAVLRFQGAEISTEELH